MARRKRSNPFEEQEPELNISPLVDVAFLLLIYFLVTASLMKEEADLGLELPGAATITSSKVRVDHMEIKIDPIGNIIVNEVIVEPFEANRNLPILTDRLKRYVASAKIAGAKASVVIDCSSEVREQRFVDVLNACSAAGMKNISLAQK
ncbi:MAG: biopolymer transporter ExbD [Verrucomicrobiota bacterium]